MLSQTLIALIPLALLVVGSDDPSKFAPYGIANGDALAYPNDDDSFGPFDFLFPFYGIPRASLYVNNNGLITFNGPVGEYTPNGLCSVDFPAIAPYWADVDTRNGGNLYYRASTDPTLLATWSSQVGDPNFHGVRMYIITWDTVGYYYEHNDKTDSFQAILITDGTNSYVFFNYGLLQWTTGDASGGTNGLGGTPASVGFSAGDGSRCVQTSMSLTSNVLNEQDFVTLVSGGIISIQTCGNGRVEGTEQCDGGSCCLQNCMFNNTTPCFCARQNLSNGAMGYYCNANGGFYQCLGGAYASQSKQMACSRGTQCGCNFGTECSCNQRRSPCITAGTNSTCPPQ